jgi:hypothetical protein
MSGDFLSIKVTKSGVLTSKQATKRFKLAISKALAYTTRATITVAKAATPVRKGERPRSLSNTGLLKRSWVSQQSYPSGVTWNASGTKVEIKNTAPYASWVDEGFTISPHWVPRLGLVGNVRQKCPPPAMRDMWHLNGPEGTYVGLCSATRKIKPRNMKVVALNKFGELVRMYVRRHVYYLDGEK